MTETVAVDLSLEAESARLAREKLEPFRGSVDERSFADLRLLVSELVVEALSTHPDGGDERVKLRAELCNDRVRVELADGSAAYRLLSRRPRLGETGWGLYLVRRLSSRWGIRREPGKAMVWLELPPSSPEPS